MSESPRRVVVVGSGATAWIAAAGLMRALSHRSLDVLVVEAANDDEPVGFWTLPSQRGIHGLLGVQESHFLQHTGSMVKLAIEHTGWQGEGTRYLHAHGEMGTEIGGSPFYRYLQREALQGRPANAEDFSVAAVAARLGRFARPTGTELTASFTYGFHIETRRYADYLRQHAQRLGVRVAPAAFATPSRTEDGAIASLGLADGSVVEGDLFLDCSGSRACLANTLCPARDDWSPWLPADRLLSVLGPGKPEFAALTQTFAGEMGWLWRAPLAAATMSGITYRSSLLSDDAARATLAALEPAARGDMSLTRIAAGRRQQFWSRNCVALGAAAMELEPLAGAGLHFALLGLATLVELFPLTHGSVVEAAEYNRLIGEHADALRDFTIAHYRAGRARKGAFWEATRTAELPASLAHKLDLYAANGRIHVLDQETFEEVDWAWLLIGSGCLPAAMELQVRDLLAKLPPAAADSLRMSVRQVASSMPALRR
jgi:tryptophan 7-halogenase